VQASEKQRPSWITKDYGADRLESGPGMGTLPEKRLKPFPGTTPRKEDRSMRAIRAITIRPRQPSFQKAL
jgi:hypothetical protein